jgi:ABC-type multidrug transport system fused ATPase/permease subunit
MKAGSAVAVTLRKNLFESMMRTEVTFFDTNSIGSILTLISEDVRSIQDAFGPVKGTQLQGIATFIAAVIAQFIYYWKMALIYLGSLVILFGGAAIFAPFMDKHSKVKAEMAAQSMTIAEEAVSAIRTIRGFNREEEEFRRYSTANRTGHYHEKISGAYTAAMVFVMFPPSDG